MRSSSRCPVLLGCVLLTLFTLYALGAGAQPASDVILLLHVQLADGGWPEAEQRARAELEADGFTIVVVESPPTHRLDAELPNLVRAQGAIAALRIARARDATEGPLTIYLLDRVTGKTSTRWIDPQQPDLTSGRVGLLAVELLHASLIELTLANQSLGEVEPTPAVQRVVARELEPEPRFPRPLLRFGPGLLLTRGGHGVVGGVAVAGGLQLTRLAGVELDGFTTVVPSQVEGRPGSAEVFFTDSECTRCSAPRSRARPASSWGRGLVPSASGPCRRPPRGTARSEPHGAGSASRLLSWELPGG